MWFERYGWKENPFTIKLNTNLVGLEEEKNRLLHYTHSGDICFLTGPHGIGKSSLLRWLQVNLRKHTIIYIDAEEIKNFLGDLFRLEDYMKHHRTTWQKLIRRRYPKNIVILLDEAQATEKELTDALKLHWGDGNIKSIVITQVSPNLDKFSESFKHRIGDRVITLDKLSKSTITELVNLRTNLKNPFEGKAIELIAEKSDYIPRKVLENCELVCIAAKDPERITLQDVEEVLIKHPKMIIEVKKEMTDLKETPSEPTETKKLSPMQERIVDLLSKSNRTTQEIANILNTSEGSVGKQLSKLAKANIVKIVSQKRPKIYCLS